MARPLCGFQIQMIQSPHIYQWMGMSVSFGKHWAKCCQDHLVSLSKQLPLRPRNNSSTVALLRLTHFFWPKIHGVLRRVGGLGLSLQCWTLSPFLAVHSLHCSGTGSVQSLSRVLILAKLRGLQISFGLIKIGRNLQETFRVIGGQLL